jgi:hypothetical protein
MGFDTVIFRDVPGYPYDRHSARQLPELDIRDPQQLRDFGHWWDKQGQWGLYRDVCSAWAAICAVTSTYYWYSLKLYYYDMVLLSLCDNINIGYYHFY